MTELRQFFVVVSYKTQQIPNDKDYTTDYFLKDMIAQVECATKEDAVAWIEKHNVGNCFIIEHYRRVFI
jgi:hypothetical protein